MKAVLIENFGGPEVLKVVNNHTLPGGTLESNQVLVKVYKAGLNPVDTYIREGKHAFLPQVFPYIPGNDAAGIVEATGDNLNRPGLKVGTRVFVNGRIKHSGACAGYLIAQSESVFPLHKNLSFAQGAAIGVPYFTAYKALILLAQAKSGDKVLIHGASGAVGTAAVQIAKSLGIYVVGSAGTDDGMEIVKKCGADGVFNHNNPESYENLKEILQDETFNGFDVIIENLANVNLDKDLNMIKRGSRIMIVGCRGSIEINPRLLMIPEAKICGVALPTASDEEWKIMERDVLSGFENGSLAPIIAKEYPVEKVAEAHIDIIESKGAKGKLIISFNNEEE